MFPTEDGPHGFPQEITPEGMTRARKEYLYKNIRQYCKDEFKDVLCPCPEPNAEESTGAVDPDDDGPEAVPGPSKKRRLNVFSMLKHETLVLTTAAVDHIEEKLLFALHRTDDKEKTKKFRINQQ
ncbi:54S ribosomal protein L4, mitochondrial [Homalodisca vitripennis]|nr:54S ribosomal protein L4, mitochondrial [Homalodisca vitripennis]